MNTITFKEFDSKGGSQRFDVDKLDDKPAGCEIVFARGSDDRTNQPKRYTALLQPGAKTGSWTAADQSGELEHVERKDMGTEHTITGIWIEDGKRLQFEVFFWK